MLWRPGLPAHPFLRQRPDLNSLPIRVTANPVPVVIGGRGKPHIWSRLGHQCPITCSLCHVQTHSSLRLSLAVVPLSADVRKRKLESPTSPYDVIFGNHAKNEAKEVALCH